MLVEEFRHAFRVLRTYPAFAAAVVLIMALALGANTAVFTLVNAVILSPLPFRDPARLVEITGRRLETARDPFSIPDFRDLRERTRAFETLAAAFQWSANITGGDAERLQGMRATSSLFATLGVPAMLGRTLIPEDEQGSGRRVVLLTYGLWTRRFGGHPAVVGSTIVLNGEAHTVVGILPPAYITPIREADVIAPFPIDTDPRRGARDSGFLRVVGRLGPGVSIAQATADLDAIVARLRVEYPATNATHSGVRVLEWHSALIAGARPLLVLLQAAVALVLAIACANLANLFLASALRREREFAVRAALGASRGRLVRDVIVECAMLAAPGGAGGILIGMLARRALQVLAPGDLLRVSGGAPLDWRVASFAAAAMAIATLAFAAVPGWRLATGSLGAHMKSGSRTADSANGRTARRWLVGIEIALASSLVTMAVLLSQSFARLQAVDPGFHADHLLTVRLSLPKGRYPDRAAVVRFADALRPQLLALPGVVDAAAINVVPLNGYRATADIWPADRPEPPADQRPEAHYRMAGPAYFRTFGVPVIQGRALDEHDTAESDPVVLINQTLARRFWPGRSPVGRYLLLIDAGDDTVRRARIAGVVGDVKHFGLETESTPDVYVAIAQVPEGTIQWLKNNMYWGVRTNVPPDSVREAVRRAIRGVDADVPASAMRTMDETLDLAAAPRRLNLWLVRVFGLAALVLAAAGIYAVTAFSVSVRTREIGIRTALGARPGQNLRVMLLDVAKPIAIGLAAGVFISLAGAPALRSMLFNVDPVAPGAMAAVSVLLLIVGLAAAFVAAWRLRSIDPVVALRAE
jgi:putative ABC transport system permease protein